nr:GNAT family N-acetyltransferase [uncultured Agathobaculum sp.]
MLLPVTAADIPDFAAACAHEHVFGSRALTALRAYGPGDPSVHFYLCRKGREPAAALYLAGDVLTVSSDERADPLLIADLARRMGVHEIDTNWPQCQVLRGLLGGTAESSYFMVYRGAPLEEDSSGFHPGDLKAVYKVLQSSHSYYQTHLEYAAWSADLQRRIDRGLSAVFQLEEDGEVIGTGSILSTDDECGVIGAVAVVPAHRHKGLGSRITRFLVQRIQSMGKTPRLVSGYDEVSELYRRLGFAPCGRWGELYL